ncbi:MAG: hypothetical protein CLLPBCKN_007570 [Chroococcidiopsis cubana SAG 39.79]|nr:hypothetical protein [Chroococcidiopsis cubana]MDZ4878135.1 hypothetical protein [Chroococcidiopsis cubana SAG 39.79]
MPDLGGKMRGAIAQHDRNYSMTICHSYVQLSSLPTPSCKEMGIDARPQLQLLASQIYLSSTLQRMASDLNSNNHDYGNYAGS